MFIVHFHPYERSMKSNLQVGLLLYPPNRNTTMTSTIVIMDGMGNVSTKLIVEVYAIMVVTLSIFVFIQTDSKLI